jgi:hypothetical protein
LTRFVDLSPAVPEGFKGPPSTDVGVQFDGIDAASARAFARVGEEAPA